MQNSWKFSFPPPLRRLYRHHGMPPKHQQEVLICCFCNQEPPTRLTKTILAFNLNWSSLPSYVSKRSVLRCCRNLSPPTRSTVSYPGTRLRYNFLNFVSFRRALFEADVFSVTTKAKTRSGKKLLFVLGLAMAMLASFRCKLRKWCHVRQCFSFFRHTRDSPKNARRRWQSLHSHQNK